MREGGGGGREGGREGVEGEGGGSEEKEFLLLFAVQAVETDTTAANSKVQRSGIHLPEESSSSSSEGFDEHHALLHDSIANYNT